MTPPVCPLCRQMREVWGPFAVCEEHGVAPIVGIDYATGHDFFAFKDGDLITIEVAASGADLPRADRPNDAMELEEIGRRFLDRIDLAFGRLPYA